MYKHRVTYNLTSQSDRFTHNLITKQSNNQSKPGSRVGLEPT